MGFHNDPFPKDISYGSRGGPGFSTSVIVLDSGAESRVPRWSGARRSYDISNAIEEYAQLATVRTFYLARRGVANEFPFLDWLDYASTIDGMVPKTAALNGFKGTVDVAGNDQQIGTGDASTTQFQLVKRYSSGLQVRVRNIYLPIASTVVVMLDGVVTTAFTVNETTGIITFTVAPGSSVIITAGFQFYVPVRFGTEIDDVLSMALEDFSSGSIDSIPLIEVINPAATTDEFFYGGSKTHSPFTLDVGISIGLGRVQVFENPDSGRKVMLPPTTDLGNGGGPFFYLINDPSAFTIDVYEDGGVTIVGTIAIGAHVEVALNESGQWYLL